MTLRVLYGSYFVKSARKIPQSEQEKLASLLLILSRNPFHPKLHTKPLAGKLAGLYSFRITRDFRVIFHFTAPDTIVLIEAGHRKEIYR